MIASAQIDRILDRYAEIEARMASDAGASFAKLAKEYAELGPIVAKAREVLSMRADILNLTAMSTDMSADAELRSMATSFTISPTCSTADALNASQSKGTSTRSEAMRALIL